MRRLRSDGAEGLIFAVAAAMVVLAVIGGFRSFSAVPIWDMWDGYLSFYDQASSGDGSVWWKQHNEHRIVLAKILFWIDHRFFGGGVWFLLVVNYLLVALACTLFLLALRERSSEKPGVLGALMVAGLFSWSQEENLTWGFQSQFFLAQLLPLAAFYMLHRASLERQKAALWFGGALACGILALGTMANGVITLPLMALFCGIGRLGWRKCATLVALSAAGAVAYFHGYTSPANHGSLRQAILGDPIGLVTYVLCYIGGPISAIVSPGRPAVVVAALAGGFLVLASVFFAWRWISGTARSTLELAMLFFILYVGGTALGTGGGRLIFGLHQALSSRYMTPASMAWAALFVLMIPVLQSLRRWALGCGILIALISMLPLQLHALASKADTNFARDVGALAIEMGVKDGESIAAVYPSADALFSFIGPAVERDLSVFGSPRFLGIRERLGQLRDKVDPTAGACIGHLDVVSGIQTDARFLRIQGWIFNPGHTSGAHVPASLDIVDGEGRVLGHAFTGGPRPDVAAVVGKRARKAGFKGYVLSAAQGKSVRLVDVASRCELSVDVPAQLYALHQVSDPAVAQVVSDDRVLDGSGWRGMDSWKSDIRGMAIHGSFAHSDADVGAIVLQMKRGEKLLYRSGPTAGRQILEIEGDKAGPAVLPVATEWVLLDFSSQQLPENFTVKFSDRGNGWGEWSAIALRK